MSEFTLIQLTAEAQQIEQKLIETGGELTPELEAAWKDNALAIAQKVDGYHSVLRKFAMAETALDEEIKRLTALKKTAVNAQKTIKSHLKYGMEIAGLEKLEGTYCKVSFSKSNSVVVDEDAVIAPYEAEIATLRSVLPDYITADFKVSKTALKSQLEKGTAIEGAAIAENYNIQIR